MSEKECDLDTSEAETIWVVAEPQDACYAGKQIRRSKTEVEVELLDAVMLAGFGLAGEGSLTGELKRFPVEACRFFNGLRAMGVCVLRACEARRSRETNDGK